MNIITIHYLNVFLGAGAILLQIVSVVTILLLFFILPEQKKNKQKNHFLDYLDRNFLSLGFGIALVATLFSLVYSEVIHFPPCMLCWWQRIFIYPQVFLFGVALWNNFRHQLSEAKNVIRYSLPLLIAGFLVTLYQNFVYYFGERSSVPCDASGISCYKQYISEFGGYISIPMLALSAFVALLTLVLVVHFYAKE